MALPHPVDAQYSFASPRRQLFSFPPDMIALMLKNPSSHKGLLKLYQTCKYFWSKRPILIAENLTIQRSDTKILLNGVYKSVSDLQIPVWAINSIRIGVGAKTPQLFRFSVKNLELYFVELPYKDFETLTSERNITSLITCGSIVHHSDNSRASIDELLQLTPRLSTLHYYSYEVYSKTTTKKLNDIKFSCKFQNIELYLRDVHPTFDLNAFCEFIMKNSNADTIIKFDLISDATEKMRICLPTLDAKWKTEAYGGLKDTLLKLDPNP